VDLGRTSAARFQDPLAGAPPIGLVHDPPVQQNGTGGLIGATVNVGALKSMRLIADPSDWDKTQQGIATGESGLPKNCIGRSTRRLKAVTCAYFLSAQKQCRSNKGNGFGCSRRGLNQGVLWNFS
jgi:hypothetical protein